MVTNNRQWAREYGKTERGSRVLRNSWYKTQYGISLEEYERMLVGQNGVCAICGSPPGARRLHVDHNHETDQVRELLCPTCNIIVGLIETSDRLPVAIAYLEKHNGQ